MQKRAKNIIIFSARERIYTSTAYVFAFSPRDHWCRVYNFVDCCANSRPTALSCLLQLLNVTLSNRHRFTRHRCRREDSNNRIGISISTYYVPLFPRHINFQSFSRHSLLGRWICPVEVARAFVVSLDPAVTIAVVCSSPKRIHARYKNGCD